MPSTINNEASTTYQFAGSSDTMSATSNQNTIILEENQGLNLTKTASVPTFSAGDIITYTVRITNSSASYLNGVRIIDDLGGGNLAYVIGSANLTTSSGSYPVSPVATNPLTFTLQQLPVGATMTLTYRSQVIFNLPSTVDSITNNVRGIGYTASGTINGFASHTIQKKNSVSLSIAKSSSVNEVFPNQSFNYYLTLTNNNSVQATANTITDQLPSNFVLTSVSVTVGTGSPTMLDPSNYTLSASNLLTIPSSTGTAVTIPAGGRTVITITGYFN